MLQIQYNWYNDSDLDSAAFNQEWLTDWLDRAEQRLGFTNFTVIVDAFWQYRHTPEGRPQESRFPDFRGFIDECHRRGHKVILWTCPQMLIDSDGAIMIGEWVEETYIKAVLYSTPSLYYIDVFHDRVKYSDEKMKQLGDLLQLSEKKLPGVPSQLESGDWELVLDGNVVGRTYGGHTVILLGKDGIYYLFSWKEEIQIPVFDEKMDVSGFGLEIKDGILQGRTKPGQVYMFSRKG